MSRFHCLTVLIAGGHGPSSNEGVEAWAGSFERVRLKALDVFRCRSESYADPSFNVYGGEMESPLVALFAWDGSPLRIEDEGGEFTMLLCPLEEA